MVAIDVTYELADEDADSIAKSNNDQVSELHCEFLATASNNSGDYLGNIVIHGISGSPSQKSPLSHHEQIMKIEESTKYSIDEDIEIDINKYKK